MRNPRSVRTGGGYGNLVYCLVVLASGPRRCVGYAYYYAYYRYTNRNNERGRGGGNYI